MANVFVDIAKGIEIGAEDALKWLTGAEKASPAVIAALGTLAGAVNTALADAAGAAAAEGANIALDVATVTSLKAVWPQVVTFLKTLGITV